MKLYMILMRGNQEDFSQMGDEARRAMIQAHVDFAKGLAAKGALIDGDGFVANSLLLTRAGEGDAIQVEDSPYRGTAEQLSGFYLIKVESDDQALEIARACPSLQQGETVELIALGH